MARFPLFAGYGGSRDQVDEHPWKAGGHYGANYIDNLTRFELQPGALQSGRSQLANRRIVPEGRATLFSSNLAELQGGTPAPNGRAVAFEHASCDGRVRSMKWQRGQEQRFDGYTVG